MPSTTRISLIMALLYLCFGCQLSFGKLRQESTRSLGNDRAQGKFLTLGEVDNWVFDAAQNETLIVKLTTNEFDGVLGLARTDGESDEILFSKDQEGSNCQFSHRIESAGKYKIRVHGYQNKGGGNYQLSVQRFVAKPITVAQKVSGRFNKSGNANFFFEAKKGQNLVLVSPGSITLYDPFGDSLPFTWHTSIIFQKDGEHLVNLSGVPGNGFEFLIRPVETLNLNSGDATSVTVPATSLNVWDIDAEPGQFQVITVSRNSRYSPRLIFAPSLDPNEQSLDSNRRRGPDMQFLPVSSKGDLTKYAVVFGRKGKFQLQVFAHSKSTIDITMTDPTIDLDTKTKTEGQLAVGGSAYYGGNLKAGDLVKMKLRSKTFDCVLKLFDHRGRMVDQNDDFENSKNSQLSRMMTRSGFYRWQISSLGNGGGGEFNIDFEEIPKKQLSVGKAQSSKLQRGATEYWTFKPNKHQGIYINTKSGFATKVHIFDEDGRTVAQNSGGGIGSRTLIALNVNSGVTYTVAISANHGNRSGNYSIRVMDAEWDD